VPAVVNQTVFFHCFFHNERFIHPQKRPLSLDGPFHPNEIPPEKQNSTFKSPHQTPQKSSSDTQNKLPPGHVDRYGMPPGHLLPPFEYLCSSSGRDKERSRSLSTLKDSHYESMQTAGVFVDAGDFE
jgi:hypothetical protein